MCGRYFWNDDAQDAFEEDFPELAGEVRRLRSGDYTPGMNALALTARESHPPGAELIKWGFPGFDKGKLLINARAESVETRPTFRDSFADRRCVLPAAGFYEWDRKKEKVIFTLPDRKILYLAGIYRPYGPEKRFVVLTREANSSMEPVHDRMPLILAPGQVELWVRDAAEAGNILTMELPALKAERPYEQMTFEW